MSRLAEVVAENERLAARLVQYAEEHFGRPIQKIHADELIEWATAKTKSKAEFDAAMSALRRFAVQS